MTVTSVLLFLLQPSVSSSPYLHLDPVVSVTQVLQVGGGVGLDGGEVMLQHVDDLRQLRVTPSKLPVGKQREKLQRGSFNLHFNSLLSKTQHRVAIEVLYLKQNTV